MFTYVPCDSRPHLFRNPPGHKPIGFFGLVHSFQKDRVRNAWNADFPNIKSEGGLPGSQEAGLVAFLRESLVDLGGLDGSSDEEEEEQKEDSEAQIAPRHAGFEDVNTNLLVFPAGEQRSQAEAEWSQFQHSVNGPGARM